MGAVDLLCVEPDIPAVGVLARQPVVLAVAAAHQDPQARCGAELPRAGGPLEAGLLFAPAPEVAALRQLGTDVVEVLLQLRLLRRLPQRLHLQRMRCNFPAVL